MPALSMILLFLATESHGSIGDYALWNDASANKGGTWTAVAEKEVRAQGLPNLEPKDIATFCHAYAHLSTDDRAKVWVYWMSAIAKYETKNFDPMEDYPDKPEPSRGLFQLSVGSASSKFYGCGPQTIESLHDPESNITCAVKTIGVWLKRDGVIGTREPNTSPTGVAKMFGTLWPGKANHPRENIIRLTQSFPLCMSTAARQH